VTITGSSITNNTAAKGAGVYVSGISNPGEGGENVKYNMPVTMTDGTISGNHATENGGAVYVDAKAAIILRDGTDGADGTNPTHATITGNRADGAGAGIYVAPSGVVELSGAPDFGGTDRKVTDGDDNDDLKGTEGNFVTTDTDAALLNGGKGYPSDGGKPKVRQDIYLAETGAENPADEKYTPASIVVAGDITSPEGSIWIFAEDQYRHKQLMPFAVMAPGISFVEGENVEPEAKKFDVPHLKAFRNAQDDDTTENGTDTYLYGTVEEDGENPGIIYWTGSTGSRKVILRKVNSTYGSLSGKEFTVYKGTSTTPYKPKGETEPLSGLVSQPSGVFWIGTLPNGTYIIEEKSPNRFFYVIVDDSGVYGTLYQDNGTEKDKINGYDNRADAENAAKEKTAELKAAKTPPADGDQNT
jgi:predicted outer membrane repeat protein